MGNKVDSERSSTGRAVGTRPPRLSKLELRADPVIRYNSENEAAVFLTTANLIRTLQYIWGPEEKIESKWRTMASVDMFRICPTRVKEITKSCTCDRERLERVVQFWLTWYPYASWRWWVEWFERALYSEKAVEMRKYAEQITDPTLTVDNIAPLLRQVNIPSLISTRFTGTALYSNLSPTTSGQEPGILWCKWWLASSSQASWEYLAEELYYSKEDSTLQLVKKYLKQSPDPTLTVENLCAVLAPIKDWNKFKTLFKIPQWKLREIANLRLSSAQEKEAILEEFVNNHPAPSWKRVAYAVYQMAYIEDCYDILQVIHQKYINDFSLQNLCIFAVRKFLRSPDDVHHLPLPGRLKSLISL